MKIPSYLTPLLAMPRSAYGIAAASIGALLFAFTLQFGFGVLPCQLCLWQRVPFSAAAALALMALYTRPYGKHTQALLGSCAVLFLANAGIAVFHSGVERHWWEWHSACTGLSLTGDSLEAMREKLLAAPVTRCDEITWSLFGLSMANWNIPFSLMLATVSGMAARAKK